FIQQSPSLSNAKQQRKSVRNMLNSFAKLVRLRCVFALSSISISAIQSMTIRTGHHWRKGGILYSAVGSVIRGAKIAQKSTG
ncbi:hypothetical protein ACN4E3_25760, partial [Klebsiella pneumoniae]|uniref:hypothetical protein n=1 Tax=Klebsiella pneumoniae TaxID=573 RepID=UPI003AF697E1